jgi:hypothetical protein
MKGLHMLSELPEGWSYYVLLSDLEFGACKAPRGMPLEASQEIVTLMSRANLVFTENPASIPDSGVPWTLFSE